MANGQERSTFYATLAKRRSVREFSDREIPDDVLERVLEIGRLSASAANRQPWYFLVARKRDDHPLYRLVGGRGFQDAPVLLAGLADPRKAWVRKWDGSNYARVDVTIALAGMIMAATAEGLGSCWIAAVDPAEVRRLLILPAEIDVVSLVALGWPTEPLEAQPKDRKPFEAVIRRGVWTP